MKPRIDSPADSPSAESFDPAGDLRRTIEAAFRPALPAAPQHTTYEEAAGWSPRARVSFLFGAATLCWGAIALSVRAII